MNVYDATDVFTPTSPAIRNFIERESINDKMVNALITPGKQIIVYGHTGSGKTTLIINKLNQLYENHIFTRCESGLTVDQLLLSAFDQLKVYYEAEKINNKKRSVSTSVSTDYFGIKSKIDVHLSKNIQSRKKPIVPPQLTPEKLAKFLGEVNCCWVLEDFHKIDKKEKKRLSQIMKIFMDMAVVYKTIKIVCIGAVNTAREVVEYDKEMQNRVAEICVPLMTKKELRLIMTNGEKLLNFSIDNKVKDLIVSYSKGLAAVCHQLCLNLCFTAGINETLKEKEIIRSHNFREALKQFIEDSSDTLKADFDKALRTVRKQKYQNCRLIIHSFAESSQDGLTYPELKKKINQLEPLYSASNLTRYLKQLQTNDFGNIIEYDAISGKYSFIDPLHHTFALALIDEHRIKYTRSYPKLSDISIDDLEQVTRFIENHLEKFSSDYFRKLDE